MADAQKIPIYRRYLSHILKRNEFRIPDTADEIMTILNLHEDNHDTVGFLFK